MKKALIALLILSNFSTTFASDDAWAKQAKANDLRRAKEAKALVDKTDKILYDLSPKNRGYLDGWGEIQKHINMVRRQGGPNQIARIKGYYDSQTVEVTHVIDGKEYRGKDMLEKAVGETADGLTAAGFKCRRPRIPGSPTCAVTRTLFIYHPSNPSEN